MAIRLQELHPSLVHFPIALLPLSLAADIAGQATRDRRLSWLGRWGMVAGAISGAVAALAGLIAQEEVNVEGPSMDTLITHRNLNLGLVALTSVLATRRMLDDARPGPAYMASAALGVGALLYSGYLGGKVVYEYGVGVGPANGLWQGGGPALTPRNASRVARSTARDIGNGFKHLAQEIGQGKLAPSIFGSRSNGDGQAATTRTEGAGSGGQGGAGAGQGDD